MPLNKHEHWQTRSFHAFLLERCEQPFAWGTNDCALFAADAILANTGIDIAAEFRGKYATEEGAFAAIKSITGGATVADAAAWCAENHGLIEHEFPLMAKRGDLVIVANGANLIAGVVHLNGRHVVVISESGIRRLPITNVKRAWGV